jgi:poly-gamma-glutamate capsule biosynthesis protein CapA/YwtB (metallophosphatase superfamily)
MERRDFLKTLAQAAAVASAARVMPGAAQIPDRFTLTAVGDCILAREVSGLKDPDFLAVVELLRGADCAWGNCESVLADARRVSPAYKQNAPYTISPPWAADELAWSGIRLMGTANNHTMDFGDGGLSSTLENLARVRIVQAGAGADLAQAAQPAFAESAGGRIGLVSCASTFIDPSMAAPANSYVLGRPGLNPLRVEHAVQVDPTTFEALRQLSLRMLGLAGAGEFPEFVAELLARFPKDMAVLGDLLVKSGTEFDTLAIPQAADVQRICEAIAAAKNGAQVVIAANHAHEIREKPEQPERFLQPFAHACLDAGADLYVSAGPHVLQGIEIYKGKPIFYSLGNFFFHYESIPTVPPEALAGLGLPPTTLDSWTYYQKIPYHKEPRFWQSVLPRLTYERGRLAGVELFPISLGFGQSIDRRGTPRLARGPEAAEILTRLAKLSEPYGTRIQVDGEVGRVQLG